MEACQESLMYVSGVLGFQHRSWKKAAADSLHGHRFRAESAAIKTLERVMNPRHPEASEGIRLETRER